MRTVGHPSREAQQQVEAENRRLGFSVESGPDPSAALRARVTADLAKHPNSPTLTAIAERDATGAVIGTSDPGTRLAGAYLGGAPIALIAKAERLAAFIGQPGDVGYACRARGLQCLVRALNGRLHHYSGLRRVLDTLTCIGPTYGALGRVEALVRRLVGVQLDAERATKSTTDARGRPPHSGPDPPSLARPYLAPIRRHGPPAFADRALAPRMETGRPLLAA